MPKKLTSTDFRAFRQIFTSEDSPAIEVEADEIQSALVKPEIWHSIQDMTDTVCIATSGAHGPELELEDELYFNWLDEIEIFSFSLPTDAVSDIAFEAETEWRAATSSALNGFYRQAIATLRNALELCVVAARYQKERGSTAYLQWLENKESYRIAELCKELASDAAKDVNAHLLAKGARAFVNGPERQQSNWVYDLYRRLCAPTHSRPGSRHRDYWKRMSGPIYERDSFIQFHALFLETMAASWMLCKLVRRNLKIPDSIRGKAEAGEFGMEAKEMSLIFASEQSIPRQ
jgi:hypothetical protein